MTHWRSRPWEARLSVAAFFGILSTCGAALIAPSTSPASPPSAPRDVAFSQSAEAVDAYDFVEVTAALASPDAGNPFTDAALTGWFETADGSQRWTVEGFCDAEDGSAYRIRFMPPKPGDYRYFVVYRQGNFEKTFEGIFHANDGRRRGPIRADPQYPWHFIWEGTGEHYFFNGTTAYWLMGWNEDRIIDYIL